MKKTATKAEPTDYLKAVRDQLGKVPRSDFMRIAADAGLHLRTIYAVMEEGRDPRYSTVFELYRTLNKMPVADRRKSP